MWTLASRTLTVDLPEILATSEALETALGICLRLEAEVSVTAGPESTLV